MAKKHKKYRTLKALQKAYADGELDRKKDIVTVDNDAVYLYVSDWDKDPEGDDAEEVFSIDKLPYYILIDALKLLGIPAESA